jgi:hypothetical protein
MNVPKMWNEGTNAFEAWVICAVVLNATQKIII